MVGDVVVHDWISPSDRSKDFLVSMFKAYSNMELKVTYTMCFECGMTGKRCEDCHDLCISDVPDYIDYAIEISFRYEDGMNVNLFFKKVYERKSLVWRCWMSRSGYGIVKIFKQKLFPKLFEFIKELLNEVYMIHKKCSTLDVDLKMKVNAEMILFIRNCVYLRISPFASSAFDGYKLFE